MAENQDISQVNSEDISTAPTETVSTGTDGSQIADVTSPPKYRKKVYDVLKTKIYKNNPEKFKLTEQQFYKKIDSDQEYAKKVYGVLKAQLPSTDIVQDTDQFLTKLYEKPTKSVVKGTHIQAERPEGPTSQVDKKTKFVRVAGAKEFKEINKDFQAPVLTSTEKFEYQKSDEYKLKREAEMFQPSNANVGGFHFDITESLQKSFVIKDWDNLYNQYQDIVDNYGTEEEKVVTIPKTKPLSTTYGFSEQKNTGLSIPGINPSTGLSEYISDTYASINKSILERNAIRQQYNKKIKDVGDFFDDAVDNGINVYNYDGYLTKNLSGATVASNELVRNLAKRIIATYKGKELGGFVEQAITQSSSDQALEDILVQKLKVKIETFEKVKKSKDKADAWAKQQGIDFDAKFTLKQQTLYDQNVKEIDVFNASLVQKRDAEIATVTAPYIEQGKIINESLEKLTNDYKASVTIENAAIDVPEIKNLKLNYEMTIKSLSNGQYPQDEANKLANDAYNKYVQDVTPLFNQWQEAKFKNYEATFNSEKQKIVELSATAELEAGKIASRYDNQSKSFQKLKDEQYQSKLQSYITSLQKQGVDQKLIDGYKKVFQDTYKKLETEEKNLIETSYRGASTAYTYIPGVGPFILGQATSLVNSLGDAIASSGYQLNSPILKYLGEGLSNSFSIPDMQIKSWKEIFTDPLKMGVSVGQVMGRQVPMMLSALVPIAGEAVLGSRALAFISNMAISGTVGFTSEVVDMSGSMYRRVLNETGDPVKANLASWEIVNDNKKLWYTYGIDALPYIHNFKNVIKGTGFFSMAGRFALRGGIEATTETLLQEFPQSASEDKIYYKYVRGANNITTYDMMFTNDKIIRDKYNNPLTDSKDGRSFYLTTGGLDRLKSTALNIAPASFLMGGFGSVTDYARYKYSEQVGKNMFAKNILNGMSDSFHKQQIFQILLTRGENTAAGYLVALNRSGKLSSEELANLSASLEDMKGYSKMAQRQKWKPERTMAMASLNFEVANINTQLQNPELSQDEKNMLTKKLDYSKRNLDDFLQGKKSDYVMMMIGNQLHILTYSQFDDALADQDFVNNTKGSVAIKVVGSKLNAQSENLEEKGSKILNLRLPNQDEIDEMERNGPPVMDVFANTEIPHLNNLVNDLEGRMNNAEEIDEKDMNSAIGGLYEQLQNILDNHYNTENGKRAAQMLMDTIEKFENYEFTTKEETITTTERSTTQGIREVVNTSKNIFGRITGTAKSGAKKFATVVTGFKQRGKYSVEINEKDEVVLTPMSGKPIIFGQRNDLNGKVKFVSSSFSSKTGKISTITFRINEANENGVMPEVTLSTADGFTYDELLDMAIDLRAMEIGEVTTEEFDNVVEQVTTGKSYPNMGKAEQKQKAKAEAEAAAQQQAPQEEAPQQTEEQKSAEVQRLQSQQEEELKAAQEMIKPSNLAKSGMTLNEALKARDEKIKQIKAKYKVLIDNAKKGVTQETQQQEEEQQQNNDVVDITSDNIDELQNIETDNKFQKRVLNAIPNILKALGKIVPGIKVSIHLTTQSYRESVLRDSKGRNDGRGTKGYYYEKSKTINIDLSRINSMDGMITTFHEAFHGMYKVLPENLKDILFKSIRTVVTIDGFKLKLTTGSEKQADAINKLLEKLRLKTRVSSFENFASGYKDSEQQEEATVEFLGHMASGAITLTVPGYKMFIEALNKILDKIGLGSFKITTSKQAKDFARGVVNAMKTGQDISELDDTITKTQQGQNGLTNDQEIAFRSAVSIMKGLDKLRKYGLNKGKNKTRQVAEALEKRQREITGIINRDDRSPEAMKKISSWMAEEVRYSLETEGEKSGKGWYGEFFQKGLDEMGDVFPELKTDKNARDLFTMLVAVTSDGEKVFSNFRLAAKAYAYYRENGKMPEAVGGNRININNKVVLINSLLEEYNNDIPALVKMLTTITTITDINQTRKENGLDPLTSQWPVDFELPLAAAYFGPKLGMFYSNLMGNEKYPTLDRWWSRSFNRYRGTLLPVLNRFKKQKGGLVKIGIEAFKENIMEDANATDEEAINLIVELATAYKNSGYKNKTKEASAANTIYKVLFENINDAPSNKGDREFMYDTIVMAQKKLKKTGQDLSIADIQAILWYFEKRLYQKLGVVGKIEGVSYKEAARFIIDKYNQKGSWDFNIKKKDDFESINEDENNEESDNISFRKDTADIFDQVNNLKEKIQEAENTTEKRKFASERREVLAENPSVKLIDDNFNSIVEQLKNNEEFEFKGPCF